MIKVDLWDGLLYAGSLLLLAGLYALYPPLAVILLGLGLILASFLGYDRWASFQRSLTPGGEESRQGQPEARGKA